jgi:hypothetical protein
VRLVEAEEEEEPLPHPAEEEEGAWEGVGVSKSSQSSIVISSVPPLCPAPREAHPVVGGAGDRVEELLLSEGERGRGESDLNACRLFRLSYWWVTCRSIGASRAAGLHGCRLSVYWAVWCFRIASGIGMILAPAIHRYSAL